MPSAARMWIRKAFEVKCTSRPLGASENALFREPRFNLSLDFFEKPAQGFSALPFGATVNDVECQEQVPILDVFDERSQTILVVFPFGLKLAPQRERFIMVLDHGQQIRIGTVTSLEFPCDGCMAPRIGDRYTWSCLALESVVGVYDESEFPVFNL